MTQNHYTKVLMYAKNHLPQLDGVGDFVYGCHN